MIDDTLSTYVTNVMDIFEMISNINQNHLDPTKTLQGEVMFCTMSFE